MVDITLPEHGRYGPIFEEPLPILARPEVVVKGLACSTVRVLSAVLPPVAIYPGKRSSCVSDIRRALAFNWT